MKTNRQFFQLFFKRELHPLMGRSKSNLLILVIILFTTFTVIGFAEGSLRYLERKMKDPFINWVNILPGNLTKRGIDEVIRNLNSENIREYYGINNAIGYNRFQFNFYDHNDILDYYQTGYLDTNRITRIPARTLDAEDPVINEVFARRNYITGRAFSDNWDIGLVVTEDVLMHLNYPLNSAFIWMDLPSLDPNDGLKQVRVAIPVPLKGVVKTLPGLARMASTSYFYQQRSHRIGQNPFNPYDDQRLLIAFTGTKDEFSEFSEKLEIYLESYEDLVPYEPNRIFSEPRFEGDQAEHFLAFVTFRPRGVPKYKMDDLFTRLYNSSELSRYQRYVFRMYDYEGRLGQYRPQVGYDRISVNFENLDRLREFSLMLSDEYDIEIDMAQIESRENYNFVSRLTGIISFVLIAFSILSVLLFVGHLLKKHLESIKRNLGTFKAFGLSNDLMIKIYVRIVLSILGISALISLGASALFGYLGGMRFILFVFGSHYEPGRYFSLKSHYLIIAVLMLAVFSLIVLYFITSRILKQTPGDLIYERK